MKTFFKSFISLDEARVSTLIVAFLITLFYALFNHYINGGICDNLLTLLEWLIGAIAGINGVSALSGAIQDFKNNNSQG